MDHTTMRPLRHLIPLILPIVLNAQTLVNNGTVISNTAVISVNGGVLNQGATGMLNNDGILIISGDFTHDAPNNCFGTSQGEVGLNGGAQTIGGSSVAVFNYLELAGTGTKTLLQDVEVGGAYAVPAGGLFVNTQNLDLGTHQLSVRNGDPTAITRNTGYIVSETDPALGYSYVRWNVGENTGNYTIPFGNAATDHYLPFTAVVNTPGVGTTGYIRMATYPTITLANPNNRPLPLAVPSLVDVSGVENAPNVLDRWWVMEANGYSTEPVANMSFTYRDSEWSTGTNTIVEGTLQLERQYGTWTMFPTVVNTGGNTLTTNGVPLSTSSWTAAEASFPLPVELMAFTGERIDAKEVLLHWSTATEHNNAGFEVWRMIEGEEGFTEVGWVAGMGDAQQLTEYTFPDANATDRISYYMLKQVDNDGQHEWTPMITVEGARTNGVLLLHPNPARDHVAIQGDLAAGDRMELWDATGRLARDGSATAMINGLVDLPRGVYTVVLLGERGRRSARLVLE